MMEKILAEPSWLVAWVMVLVVFNTASLIFIRRTEARWTLLAWVLNGIFMNFLFYQFGYVRLLGLSHVIFWTPLLVYLWQRRDQWMISNLSGKWLVGLFTVNSISLIIDYIDVVRWFLGERAAMA